MGRAALAAGLVIAAIASGCADEERRAARAPSAAQLELLRGPNGREKAPYMGVSCKVPNSITCDRVGLAVGLSRPAAAVTASFNGRRRLELESPGKLADGGGTGWQGFVQPAGLASGDWGRIELTANDRWLGDSPAGAVVRLTARYTDGTSASRLMLVPLMPGWG